VIAQRVAGAAFLRRDLRVALIPWVVARIVVIAGLYVTRYLVEQLGAEEQLPLRQGLFGWDATFYRLIAEHGYDAVGEDGLRFFPLVPIVARGLGFVFFGNTAVALLLVVNGSALVFGALLHRLVLYELHDARAARRAVWFGSIIPPAVVLVMGYAEATLLALAVGVFLAIRTQRYGWAIALGLCAGLCRPFGMLLVLPIAIEAVRTWHLASTVGRVERAGAVLAPAAGLAAFLVWAQRSWGDVWLPIRVQGDADYRGDFVDPLTRVVRAVRDMGEGDLFDSGRALLWLVVLLTLLVVLARRLPISYAAYAGTAVVVAWSSEIIQSFERYAMGAFPFAIGFALVTARVELERGLLVVFGAGLAGYSVLVFSGVLVP